MTKRFRPAFFLLAIFLSRVANAQVLSFPQGNTMQDSMALNAIQTGAMNFNLFTINSRNADNTPLQSPSGSVSMLDLKAPGKATREYDKGFRLLLNKDPQGAILPLVKAIEFYANYVAAHNALGTAYLNLNENEKAHDEFAKAIALDEHLPSSYLNLGIAQLALKDNSGAEESFRKASSIAPLDRQLSVALAYVEFINHDYDAVIATAHQVHQKNHKGAEVVHFFAAGAQEAKNNLAEAQQEMETLLQEDPKSPSVDQFRQILEGIKAQQAAQIAAKLHPPELQKLTFTAGPGQTTEEGARQAQQALQDLKERSQIAEAEAAPEPTCAECGTTVANAAPSGKQPTVNFDGPILHTSVEEVGIFFAATDHGKSVIGLTQADIALQDDDHLPEEIRGFRNESQLPLRLGLIIDTSESITNRFSFEQKAAVKFLQGVVTDKNDRAFVIGVNNSVLLVQDFTSDQTQTALAINQLAPGGGTSLWDAIDFAAEKLAGLRETQPVTKVLVVISDGKDNSSSVTLKDAIDSSLRSEIAIYTVSTRDLGDDSASDMVGDTALRTLSDLTGGAAFAPGSLRRLAGSLADVQQVIRGRYLVSYKPAHFDHDGRYRKIEIKAQKDGRPLKVYARKGYYAATAQPAGSTP